MKSCCASTSRDRKCRRKSDKKIFSLPRRFTKKRCVSGKVRGFTMRSSCAPYKGCKVTKKRRKHKGGAAPPPRDMPNNLHEFMEQITYRRVISAETNLISLFSKFARGFTENYLSDLSQEIRDEIRTFNGDTNSLLFMLFLLTMREEIELEYRSVPSGLRGLFINETNNIRNELLQSLSRLHYHLHPISHFMNIEPDLITHEWIMGTSPDETPTIRDSIGEGDDGISLDDGGPMNIDDLEAFDDFNGGKKRRAKRTRKRTHKRRKHKKTGKSLKKKHYKKHK